MSTTLVPPAPPPARAHPAWPRPARCPNCQQPILQARHASRTATINLDPTPALPHGKCEECRGRGTTRYRLNVTHAGARWPSDNIGAGYGKTSPVSNLTCNTCHGTGHTGEPINPATHARINPDGIVQPAHTPPQPWDAWHKRHDCTGSRP